MTRLRVLFFAEAVTLAHAARPVVLAKSLDPARYDVHLAWAPRYQALFGPLPGTVHAIRSLPTATFVRRLARGQPLYDLATLRAYVAEERALIERLNPDVVVGDFRLSLAVSAPLTGKPYCALINAYWSPYARQRYTVPETPLNRWLGIGASQALFDRLRPALFALHTVPLNRLRRRFGLPGFGGDLLKLYTHADRTLYTDLPELVPTYDRPAHHRYLGPLLWSPETPLPGWWDALPDDRPLVYLTLGSSGEARLLPAIVAALATLPVTVLAATAGAALPSPPPANLYAAEFLPGLAAARRAALVICNGGSPTTQQALAAGAPVLGIARNLDQYLNMDYLQRAGVGLTLRSDALNPKALTAAVRHLLDEPAYRARARALGDAIAAYPSGRVFEDLLAEYA
ncbi:glycosyltransferase [Candidatus Methylocalor cossyra]|uniref:Glycosyl transferase family 1 n=1 Tax=Candidatus Methylocalor cossyra TaxID=3108543 RepID=A0ABM9NER3_9GAMM